MDDFRYGGEPFVIGTVDSPIGPVRRVTTALSWADRRGGWRVRWSIGRHRYRVRPGLWAVGTPDSSSPVLVTANYKLSFDCVRSALLDRRAWLLVVDTHGVNVWCSAGKGVFSATEVVRMVEQVRLAEITQHRRLLLPQLSAPGVAAREVVRGSGFSVTFGPLRAVDIPAFFDNGMHATEEMRSATFTLRERLAVIPEALSVLWHAKMLAICAAVLAISAFGGSGFDAGRVVSRGLPLIGILWAAVLAGALLTPVLLPWLPGRAFALKGAEAGLMVGATLGIALNAMKRGLRGGMLRVSPRNRRPGGLSHDVRRIGSVKEARGCLSAR